MKKKLLTVVTVAAVISLTLSTYAVVMCAQAFSRKLQNITGANESAGAAAVTDPVCASSLRLCVRASKVTWYIC